VKRGLCPFPAESHFSDVDIGFHATAAPNLLAGSQVQLIAPSFTGDGSVTAIHDACPNGSFDPGLTCSTSDVNAIVTDTSALTDLLEGTAFAPAKTAAFFTDIGLDPGLSGTASVRAVSVTVNSIPEPAELGFLSGAGAALVLLSRLRRGRN